jgi:FkbM family methyltransferase
VISAHVPVALEVPAEMKQPVEEVFAGEYEAGFFGEGLTILDIGANVGAFSLWASLRWPGSTIHAFEPHPGTFAYLRRNLSGLTNAVLHNVAVFPTDQKQLPFFTRYDGDGESGLADCMARTFVEALPGGRTLLVDVIHPAELPQAEIVKLDVEGAEADVLRHLPLSGTELILLEYQDDENRSAIKQWLADDFVLEFEDAFAWDKLLAYAGYRRELAGNHYGRMFFSSRRRSRLRQLGPRRRPTEPSILPSNPPTTTGGPS